MVSPETADKESRMTILCVKKISLEQSQNPTPIEKALLNWLKKRGETR
jgi:hypothetical protein